LRPPGALSFDSFGLSEAGGRPENQDCTGSLHSGEFWCWVVADGLGGHHGGATAARLAIDSVLKAFHKAPGCSPELVRNYLEAAHSAVRERQRSDHKLCSMRTTAVVLLTSPSRAVWAHIGDTRLYHFRARRIVSQTRDHSVPQALADSGEISPADIRFHEDRNRLLHCLGARDAIRPAVLQETQPIATGDAFLLCTDGFWEYVTEAVMERELSLAATPREWVDRMRSEAAASFPAEHDNYSAIAIFAVPSASRYEPGASQ
jgi:serine/threonine protein phosphatase PrpC